MSRYRKIDPRMWGDAKFRALSCPKPNAQTLWFYLLTGPHTTSLPGLWIIGEVALAEALGWPLKSFRRCFAELEASGMAAADWPARVLLVPNVVRYDPPASAKVVTHWAKLFGDVPDSPLKERFRSILALHLERVDEPFHEDFRKAFHKGFGKAKAIPDPLPDPDPFPSPSPEPNPHTSPLPRLPEITPEISDSPATTAQGHDTHGLNSTGDLRPPNAEAEDIEERKRLHKEGLEQLMASMKNVPYDKPGDAARRIRGRG